LARSGEMYSIAECGMRNAERFDLGLGLWENFFTAEGAEGGLNVKRETENCEF
jgi:hypothetical protein